MIHIETDLYGPNPPGSSWWDVPVSEVSRLESTQQARLWYDLSCRSLVTQDFLDYCCGVGGYVGLGGDGLTGDLDGDLA